MNFILQRFARPPAGRRLHALAATAALLLGAVGAAAPAQAWEMRVCADPNYMPFSNRDLSGYENKIAKIIADDLGAQLSFVWWQQTDQMVNDELREGNCDMIMGVPDDDDSLLPTIAYYRSPYTFVYRTGAGYDISTFDDDVLKTLKLGVTVPSDPPDEAMLKRSLLKNVVMTAAQRMDLPANGPFGGLIQAVAEGDIDVAMPWGPVGGYYASRQKVPLTVVPTPEFDLPFVPMYRSVVIGVRQGDESLRDRLNVVIANRWDDINAVLKDYGVPLLDIPQPTATIGGQ